MDTGDLSSHIMLRSTVDHQFSFVHFNSRLRNQCLYSFQTCKECSIDFLLLKLKHAHNQKFEKPISLKVFGYRIAKIGYGLLCQVGGGGLDRILVLFLITLFRNCKIMCCLITVFFPNMNYANLHFCQLCTECLCG